MIVDIHPEFGIELVLATPYIYWLHTQGELEAIHTSKDMKPFYYFCDDVVEKYNMRTIDNAKGGLTSLPNDWLHHNALSIFGKDYGSCTEEEQNTANGTLDYSKWTPPPLNEKYKNNRFVYDKPIVVINNSFNLEAGTMPTRYFSIECLYEMFSYLTEKGYKVIYRRPRNSSLPTIDQNEQNTIDSLRDIEENVEGIGVINDHKLTEYFEDVILFDDIVKENPDLSYNKIQCMIYANCDKFISYVGGSGILCSYFNGINIMWLSRGKESRNGYFNGDCYYKKLSNCKIITVLDKTKTYPHSIENYQELLETMKKTY